MPGYALKIPQIVYSDYFQEEEFGVGKFYIPFNVFACVFVCVCVCVYSFHLNTKFLGGVVKLFILKYCIE